MRRTIRRLILPQPDVEMGTVPVPVPVPEDAMEVNALCEETVDPPDMEACSR